MNIIEMMDGVFGDLFAGPSWYPWRACLRAIYALPMSPNDLAIYRRHTGRMNPPREPVTEVDLVVGRRGGKDRIASLIAAFHAVCVDYTAVLAPGERGIVLLLAPDRDQATILFRYISALFEVPMLARMVVGRTKDSIDLDNGIRVEVGTADHRLIRGRTIVCAIPSEFAFFPTGDSASPDTEILAALRPAMATVPHPMLICISSPYARRGELWRKFKEYYGKEDGPVLIWKAKTRAMNPTVSRMTIAAAYLRDAAAARAEYGAEFRTDVETFISGELIDSVTIPGRRELPPLYGINYVSFCDTSGGVSDSMTQAVAHVENGRAVLDKLQEIPAPFSPEAAVTEFAGTCKRYRIAEIHGDRYGAEWVREQFQKRGILYKPSEKNRSEIYLEFLPALTSAQVELLNNEKMKNQFASLERKTGRGRDIVDHGPGGHDDLCNSAAGAIVLALEGAAITLGVLEYERLEASGKLPKPAFDAGKEMQLMIQAKFMGLGELGHPAWADVPPDPCAECGSPSMTRICNFERCSQCGGQRWIDGKAPARETLSRSDMLSGKRPLRNFRMLPGRQQPVKGR